MKTSHNRPFLPQLALFWLFLAACPLMSSLSGCKSETPTENADSSQLISSDFNQPDSNTFVPEPEPTPEPEPEPSRRRSRSSDDGGSFSASNDGPETVQDNYVRPDDSPESMARSAQHRIIQMLYTDAYQSANSKLLSKSETPAGDWSLEVEISWKDRWVKKPYQIKANLRVSKMGENSYVRIHTKNPEAEALEFTNKASKDEGELGNL